MNNKRPICSPEQVKTRTKCRVAFSRHHFTVPLLPSTPLFFLCYLVINKNAFMCWLQKQTEQNKKLFSDITLTINNKKGPTPNTSVFFWGGMLERRGEGGNFSGFCVAWLKTWKKRYCFPRPKHINLFTVETGGRENCKNRQIEGMYSINKLSELNDFNNVREAIQL